MEHWDVGHMTYMSMHCVGVEHGHVNALFRRLEALVASYLGWQSMQ